MLKKLIFFIMAFICFFNLVLVNGEQNAYSIKFVDFEVGKVYIIIDFLTGKEVDRIEINNNISSSKLIPNGKYKIKEFPFINEIEGIEVDLNNSDIKIDKEFYNKNNKFIPDLKVSIKNTTVKEALAGTSIKHEFFDIINSSNVTLDYLKVNIIIPDDYLLERFFTGTYNVNTTYKLGYKTNKVNKFIYIGEFGTSEMQEVYLGFNLKKDEKVTELLMQFRNVDVGFREVDRPFIFTNVGSSLKTGTKITNKVSIYGSFRDKNVLKQSEFRNEVMGK